jgi:hypothetical protein
MTRVIEPSGARLYQRPGAVKLCILSEGRIYPLLGEAGGYYNIAPRTWVQASICLLDKEDTPPPPPAPPPTPGDDTTPPAPPPGAILVHVLHDDVARGPGLPESNKCLSDRFFPVTSAMFSQIVVVNRLLNPDMPDQEFDRNMNGLFAGNRYISNKHAIGTESFAIENLYTGGATFRAVTGEIIKKNAKQWVEVYCIDPDHLPPTPKSLAEIDLLQGWSFCVTAPEDGVANPFPQFGGRFLMPLYGKGGRNFIRADNPDRKDGQALRTVEAIPQPHNPPRPDITRGVIA